MSFAALRKRLAAVAYPQRDSFDVSEWESVQKLVAWLEDGIICCREPSDRAPLRVWSDEWPSKQFAAYLRDAECPFASDDLSAVDRRAVVVCWLLSQAMSMLLEDSVSSGAAGSSSSPGDDALFERDAGFVSAVRELADAVGVSHKASLADTLEEVARVAEARYSDEIAATYEDFVADTTIPEDIKALVARESTQLSDVAVPLGLERAATVSNDTVRAAKLLRLLYVGDLRHLQTSINRILVSVQEMTAQPRADVRLGKVGR